MCAITGGNTLKVTTTHFGELDVAEEELLELSSPLPGFPETKRVFIIKKDTIRPFQWLQSLEEAGVTFVVVEPHNFFHDYLPELHPYDAREIGAQKAEDIIVFAICVLPEDMTKMTANLRGPLIVNLDKRKLKQVFLDTDKWSVRESILEGIKRKELAMLQSSSNAEEKSSTV